MSADVRDWVRDPSAVWLSRFGVSRGAPGPCLMELVSVLAGEPCGDHPSCTDPLLAALARWVNDRVGDQARQQLSRLARPLVGVRGPDTLIATVSVQRCAALGVALDSEEARLGLQFARFAHRRVVDRGSSGYWWARLRGRPGTPREELEAVFGDVQQAMTGLEPSAVDELYCQLLRDTIRSCRRVCELDRQHSPCPGETRPGHRSVPRVRESI